MYGQRGAEFALICSAHVRKEEGGTNGGSVGAQVVFQSHSLHVLALQLLHFFHNLGLVLYVP